MDMSSRSIHQCSECKIGNVAIRQHHEHLNLLMSRLDEQQRRWMAAMEAEKLGHGGIRQVQKITGLDINRTYALTERQEYGGAKMMG